MGMLVVLLLIVLIGVPGLLVFISVRLWRSKRSIVRWIAIVPSALLIYLSFQVYWAFYPREEFYREEWIRNAGFALPDDVAFRTRAATYPDQHGDYSCVAVMEMGASDIAHIDEQLRRGGIFVLDSLPQSMGITSEFREVQGDFNRPDAIYKSSQAEWFLVAVFKGRGIVVFERASS